MKKVSASGKYWALFLATLGLVVNFWAWSLLSPLGTQLAKELVISPTQLSLLLAMPVIIGALGRIALGILTDKLGGRYTFALVCFLTALPVIGLCMTHSYISLLLVATLLGIGGASFVVGIPFLSDWFPVEKRGLIIGIYSMGNAGTALSGFLTPRLDELLGRQQTFLLVAALLIILAIVFLLFGRNAPGWKPPKTSSLTRIKKAVTFPLTRDISMVYIVTFGAFVAFGVYLPVLLRIAYGLSLTDAATRAAGFILIATLARPIGDWLGDKIGGRLVIQLSLIAIVILACFTAFQSTLAIETTIAYLTLAFTLGCANGASFALVGKLTKPEIMGSVTGVIGAAGGLGGFLPPIILGITHQQTHSYTPALFMLAVSALIVLVYISIHFRDRKVYHMFR
ncbi:MAG: MFS transporter [Candidatus Saccharimonadales bacterium]